MIIRLKTLFLTLVLGCAVALPSGGAEEIKPPFGLHWGETMTRLERLLEGAHAKIIVRRKVDGRDVWETEGILPNDLQRTLFYFTNNELVEVELQYKTDDWPEEKYNTFMSDVKRKLEAKFGDAQLITRREEPHGAIVEKVEGWKWNKNNMAIELFYFSAQNATQVFRTLSVHYKTL
jgi:hypothetical protein